MSLYVNTRKNTFRAGLVSFALLFAIEAIASLPTASGAPKRPPGTGAVSNYTLKVTIDVFSGRKNPTFLITDAKTVAAIQKMVGQAQTKSSAADDSVIPLKLGYRGVIVENVGNVPNIPSRIELSGVTIKEKGATATYLTDDGSLEDFLIEEALSRNVIDAAIAEHIDEVRFQ
jgi:hypothetical protein